MWRTWLIGKRQNLYTCYQFNIRFWLNWLCNIEQYWNTDLCTIKMSHSTNCTSINFNPTNTPCVFSRKHSEITSKIIFLSFFFFFVWILFKVTSQSLLGLGLPETVSYLPWRLRDSGYLSSTLRGHLRKPLMDKCYHLCPEVQCTQAEGVLFH